MKTSYNEVSNTDDIIDVRDLIAHIAALQEEVSTFPANLNAEQWATQGQHEILKDLLHDLEGMGGDEEHEGIWYPVTLIRDSYFEDYAQELADDIGAINKDAKWPCNCIDWEWAARELQSDYSSVEFEGVTYWTR